MSKIVVSKVALKNLKSGYYSVMGDVEHTQGKYHFLPLGGGMVLEFGENT